MEKYINHYSAILKVLEEIERTNKLTDEQFFIQNRIDKLLIALRLDLRHAIYSGGIVEDTKELCRTRNGKVYSFEEIACWVESSDRPNVPNYDPFIHLGGDCCEEELGHCRHQLLFIPKEEAVRLKEAAKR